MGLHRRTQEISQIGRQDLREESNELTERETHDVEVGQGELALPDHISIPPSVVFPAVSKMDLDGELRFSPPVNG